MAGRGAGRGSAGRQAALIANAVRKATCDASVVTGALREVEAILDLHPSAPSLTGRVDEDEFLERRIAFAFDDEQNKLYILDCERGKTILLLWLRTRSSASKQITSPARSRPRRPCWWFIGAGTIVRFGSVWASARSSSRIFRLAIFSE